MPDSPRIFWLPRSGHAPAEYEDAYAINAAAGRFAVGDGASEGSFTGLWAKLLVDDFVADSRGRVAAWPAGLPALQERWDSDVSAKDLPWYGQSSVIQGACATFLGLALKNSSGGTCQWQAVAVGDSCLLHTRNHKLLRAFPLERGEQFDNFPGLVGSRMRAESVVAKRRLWLNGRGRPGDRLWMMTDALAQWCLAEAEAGRNPWEDLERLLNMPEGGNEFSDWIKCLRESGRLRNDDVTLLAISL